MIELVSVIVSLVMFVLIMVVFTKEGWDYVSISILGAVVTVLVAIFFVPDSMWDYPVGTVDHFAFKLMSFSQHVEFDALIFLISMQIIISVAEKKKIFQWLVLKVLRITKGDHRKFFYFICTVSCLSASVISDITVAIIFVPLVIRASKILDINASPYLYGISFTINIGSLYTPFSSAENILISSVYKLDVAWFVSKFTPIMIGALFLTLFLLDYFMLRKQAPPLEERKKIILKVMDPKIVVVDSKQFKKNFIYFFTIIVAFILLPNTYIVAIVGAAMMALLNRKPFTELLKDIDWKVITFLVCIMLIIGTMNVNGTFKVLGDGVSVILSPNLLLAAITVLFLIAGLSGLLAQVPTAIVFISLLTQIYGVVPDIIIMAFLLGINIGSNFLPQGAACDLVTLNLAEKNDIKGFTYKSLLKNGSKITLVHL
ncbi:MAG: SLC13 family permease, partial [Promethearchaeota archaeon]